MPDASRPEAGVRRRARAALSLAVLFCGGTAVALAPAPASYRVTQKGRAFAPGRVALQAGESVEIVNDDGELVHHAYLDHPEFAFDIGEQGPGSRSVVTFPKKGAFMVLCGIHPKMKLVVSVK